MKKTYTLAGFILSITIPISSFVSAQDWVIYNKSNSALSWGEPVALCPDDDKMWVAVFGSSLSNGGMDKITKTGWKEYSSRNAGFSENTFSSVARDAAGHIYVGYENGPTFYTNNERFQNIYPFNMITDINPDKKYNDRMWASSSTMGLFNFQFPDTPFMNTGYKQVYNSSNAGLPEDNFTCVATDKNGVLWAGTKSSGVVKFDGTTWTFYNQFNSGLPNDIIYDIVVDDIKNVVWIATDWGLAKLSGTTWTIYDSNNSNMPDMRAYALALEGSTVWVATGNFKGISSYNGTTWTTYNTGNSSIPDDLISSIAVDRAGNKWITTMNEVAVFRTGGASPIGIEQTSEQFIDADFNATLLNPHTLQVGFHLYDASGVIINIFDLTGKLVAVENIEKNETGYHTVQLSLSKYNEGIYFVQLLSENKIFSKKIILGY